MGSGHLPHDELPAVDDGPLADGPPRRRKATGHDPLHRENHARVNLVCLSCFALCASTGLASPYGVTVLVANRPARRCDCSLFAFNDATQRGRLPRNVTLRRRSSHWFLKPMGMVQQCRVAPTPRYPGGPVPSWATRSHALSVYRAY